MIFIKESVIEESFLDDVAMSKFDDVMNFMEASLCLSIENTKNWNEIMQETAIESLVQFVQHKSVNEAADGGDDAAVNENVKFWDRIITVLKKFWSMITGFFSKCISAVESFFTKNSTLLKAGKENLQKGFGKLSDEAKKIKGVPMNEVKWGDAKAEIAKSVLDNSYSRLESEVINGTESTIAEFKSVSAIEARKETVRGAVLGMSKMTDTQFIEELKKKFKISKEEFTIEARDVAVAFDFLSKGKSEAKKELKAHFNAIKAATNEVIAKANKCKKAITKDDSLKKEKVAAIKCFTTDCSLFTTLAHTVYAKAFAAMTANMNTARAILVKCYGAYKKTPKATKDDAAGIENVIKANEA